MKKCVRCGYERQPKDEGIIPSTECPQCGIIYAKATPPGQDEARSGSFSPDSEKERQESIRPKKLGARILFAMVIIVALSVGIQQYPAIRKIISGGWYKNADGLEEAYREQRSSGKPILVLFTIPS
jgi:hypothetical protein